MTTDEETFLRFVQHKFGERYAEIYKPELITAGEKMEEFIQLCIDQRRGMWIQGVTGCGKTMILIRYLEKLCDLVYLPNFVDVYHEHEIVEIAKAKLIPGFKPIVLVDDFGSTFLPDWLKSDYEYVYHLFHAKNVYLSITTNISQATIDNTYPRAASRLLEMTKGCILPDVDRRRANEKKEKGQ